MISFDFNYHQPSTLNEAVQIYKECQANGLNPIYYAGGTEIISFARRNEFLTQAVIDIKEIPECLMLHYQNDWLVFGSAVTLTQIVDVNPFPLLSDTCRHIADHTNRNKITLGGNICGKIRYKEAILPFLLLDSRVVVLGENGFRRAPLQEIFHQEIKLAPGELLVQIAVNRKDARVPFTFIKRTKQEKVDYPLVSIAALKKDNRIRVAFSGVCAFPFRSKQIEDVLNTQGLPLEGRVQSALQLLPAQISDDILGSREYRAFVLQELLLETITSFEAV